MCFLGQDGYRSGVPSSFDKKIGYIVWTLHVGTVGVEEVKAKTRAVNVRVELVYRLRTGKCFQKREKRQLTNS